MTNKAAEAVAVDLVDSSLDPSKSSKKFKQLKELKQLKQQQQQIVVERRCIVVWLVLILVPLALLRLSSLYAFGERLRSGDPALFVRLQDALQNVNLSSYIAARCDLLDGEWVPDDSGPSYSNQTCQHIQGHQNCLKNGRPDTGYMYWRWRPYKCELPRFNPKLFLDMMKDKLMAFVGDSIARNHMQSLLCSLSQLEKPIKTYNNEIDSNVRWWFPKSNVTIATFWSPFLVLETDEARNNIPKGTSQLYLDKLDPNWLHNMTEIDVMVLSAGQWFFKHNLYFLNDTLVGCHHCNKTSFNTTTIGFYFAYHSALANVLKNLSTNPAYHGATILRSFSPDHFEDGRWDNGGTCKRTVPFPVNTTVPENTLTYEMHRVQKEAYDLASPSWSSLRLRMIDITRLSYLRPDGHPGPYRNFQPYSKEFKGYVQNDCLHWCIPGPVDAWNDLLLETLRRMQI